MLLTVIIVLLSATCKLLTHVLYAFANISSITGKVTLSDAWADTEKHFARDSDEIGNNLYGCFKQFYLLKKANRHLKVLLSIGGSTYSANFSALASTDLGRSTFASTAVLLVANLGLDGLNIDWEFPQNDREAADMYVDFCNAARNQANLFYSTSVPATSKIVLGMPIYSHKELISYDNMPQMGLGGAMWWESSADRVGNNSLIRNVVEVLNDGSGLKSCLNQLLYPNSTYDNLRAGMPAFMFVFYLSSGARIRDLNKSVLKEGLEE
ncbi:putative endochitinase 1 [Halenospora varia]|nr:putative endochitinase 1 [Halenospora varia]